MKILSTSIFLFFISCTWNGSEGSSGDGKEQIPHKLLESTLQHYAQPIHSFIPLGHLSAELRESFDFLIKSTNLKYTNHPHERTLGSRDVEDIQGNDNKASSTTKRSHIFSPKNTSTLLYSSSSNSAIDPTNFPSVTSTAKQIEPIRIVFETTEIEKRKNDSVKLGKIVEKITDNILPKVSEIWSSLLSVTPVDGNISVDEDTCYGFIDFPTNVIREGISDADLVVFVTALETINNITLCDEYALASASYCALDQYDRPVVGFINFCIDNIDPKNNEDAAVAVGVHELTHVLGFSDDLFKYFRSSDDGTPLTQRPFTESKVNCVDGSIKKMALASNSTLQQRGEEGSIYYEIVSPTVTEIARNHFDCRNLMGARLENQPTRKSCTGSHWDERYFFTDIMSPIFSSDSVSILSPLTVALIKDTGWYGEVSFASKYIKNNPFGLGAGCDFLVEDNCIEENKVPEQYEEFFCDSITEFGKDGYPTKASSTTCDPSFSHIAYCSLIDFSTGNFQQKDYKSRLNIYSDFSTSGSLLSGTYIGRQEIASKFDDPNLGSLFLQSDNCPIASLFEVDCTDPSTNLHNKLYPEENYGIHSKCFNSVFEHPVHGGIKRGICLKSYCNKEDETLEVFIGGEKIVCNHDGEEHRLPVSDDVYFICPPLLSICPQMACPSMCSGKGVCDHNKSPPKCTCDDENDTSRGCYGVGVDFESDDGFDFNYPNPNRPIEEIYYGENAALKLKWSYFSLANLVSVAVTTTIMISYWH